MNTLIVTGITYLKSLRDKYIVNLIYKKSEFFIQKVSVNIVPRRSYLRTLRKTLQEMPFIYKDNSENIVRSFIDLTIQSVDNKTLETDKKINPILNPTVNAGKFKENQKILIVGNAGVGKTTFFRYNLLSILDRKSTPFFSLDKRKVLPIFISLKIIKNTNRSPILHYILRNVPIFKGKNSLDKFCRLADRKEIFLALDGYDEISFVEKQDYIQSELKVLINSVNTETDMIDSSLGRAYTSLLGCKIWLSTRREFYCAYPLILSDSRIDYLNSIYSNKFSALRILGLGKERSLFIKTIFDNYKKKGTIFQQLLDEEQFIEDINITQDTELINLSYIPLFLTIMCYLYVNKTENEGEVLENWLNNFEDLVKECIKTLLVDLDQQKVRNLPSGARSAFNRRRNIFFKEKERFLKQFSFSLLIDGRNVFDENYIRSKTFEYFNKNSKKEIESSRILKEYSESQSINPNFSSQLLLSGIFSLAGSENGNILYDFPHRRFKEVLALDATDDPENFQTLGNNISKRYLNEFIQMVFKLSKDNRIKLLPFLLNELQTDNTEYINSLILECTEKQVELESELQNLFIVYLKEAISNNKKIKIKNALLRKINLNEDFVKYLLNHLDKNNKIKSILFIEILKNVNQKIYEDLLISRFRTFDDRKELYGINEKLIIKQIIKEALHGNPMFHQFLSILNFDSRYGNKPAFAIKTLTNISSEAGINYLNELTAMMYLFVITSNTNNLFDTEVQIKLSLDKSSLRHNMLLLSFMKKFDFQRYKTFGDISDFKDYFIVHDYFLKGSGLSQLNSFLTSANIYSTNLRTELKILREEEYKRIVSDLKNLDLEEYNKLIDCIYI